MAAQAQARRRKEQEHEKQSTGMPSWEEVGDVGLDVRDMPCFSSLALCKGIGAVVVASRICLR